MSYYPSVKIARLFEATSRNGKIYLRGRLGFANIVILKTDQTSESGQAIWHVLVSEPEDRGDYQPKAGKPDHQAPAEAAPRTFERSKLDDQIPF